MVLQQKEYYSRAHKKSDSIDLPLQLTIDVAPDCPGPMKMPHSLFSVNSTSLPVPSAGGLFIPTLMPMSVVRTAY